MDRGFNEVLNSHKNESDVFFPYLVRLLTNFPSHSCANSTTMVRPIQQTHTFQNLIIALFLLVLATSVDAYAQGLDSLLLPGEKHLSNIRQLTYGGENAEAYFSFNEKQLCFQSVRDSFQCDQIFRMNVDGSDVTLISTGKGKTTCSYFLHGDTTILYASTHGHDTACPPKPDFSKGYVWPILPTYDIFVATLNGTIVNQLTKTDGYDAEATVSPRGDKIVFTSTRDGDLDLYSMNLNGSGVKRLTDEPGYDGGAFYSADGSQIVYRSHHPIGKELDQYRTLLKEGFVRPSVMEICFMNADGSGKKQVTSFGAASFAPFFLPDGKRIIFASNFKDPKGRNFDLFLINTDGTGIEQVTFNETFDGFPMFTRDGKHLVFASNRHDRNKGETNVFMADWKE